ncbi:MAG: hypothetical protein EI684_18275 [Candidatus Viridilinea halotolerans]|uniref:Uncharacterized protein n=1 Tax=Candidatus Viridilinea halotolerans TaxID=2491704 RepID=A0A426TTF5_9CHLR|nr:MAG: hypothetical protein EI684_18275 [Candidatus Viridilinea halotolerans]
MKLRNFLIIFALVLLAPLAAQANPVPSQTFTVYVPLVSVPGTPSGITSPTSLAVQAASHLGGAGDDLAAGVAIAPDGSVIVAGTLPGYQPPGVSPTTLLNGTNGWLLRLAPTGQLRSATRLGANITGLAMSPAGLLVACGDFGLAALPPEATSLHWHHALGQGRRCAVGTDGSSALLVGNEVAVFSADGTAQGRWSAGVGTTNDLVVDSAHEQVIVTGFKQVNNNLQIPFIRAYSYTGMLRWQSYDFAADTPNVGTADTRGERLALGQDGMLYLAGSINGGTGASIFVRDPKDASQSATDRLVVTDKYTNPFNVGSIKMLWLGRFDPADGTLIVGQSLLTRRSDDRGNSISAGAMAAGRDGTLYLVGQAFAALANRDQGRINGMPVGSYGGGDAYVLVLTPDFRQRQLWLAWSGTDGSRGGAVGLVVSDTTVAMVAQVSVGAFVSHNALQAAPGGGSDAYVAIWQR